MRLATHLFLSFASFFASGEERYWLHGSSFADIFAEGENGFFLHFLAPSDSVLGFFRGRGKSF